MALVGSVLYLHRLMSNASWLQVADWLGNVFCVSEPMSLTLLLHKTSQKHDCEIHCSLYFGVLNSGWPWNLEHLRLPDTAIRLDSGTELQSDDEAVWIFGSPSSVIVVLCCGDRAERAVEDAGEVPKRAWRLRCHVMHSHMCSMQNRLDSDL